MVDFSIVGIVGGRVTSAGWKGETAKITDLPKDHTFSDTYVQITGNEGNGFSNYYVKWNGASWARMFRP